MKRAKLFGLVSIPSFALLSGGALFMARLLFGPCLLALFLARPAPLFCLAFVPMRVAPLGRAQK